MELQQLTRPATSRQNTWAALCFQGFRPSSASVLPKDPPYLLPLPGLRRTPRTPAKEKTPPSLLRWRWPLPGPVRRLLRVPQSSAHLGYRQFPSSLSWIAQHTDFHLKSADSRNPPWSHRCALPHPCRHCPGSQSPSPWTPKSLENPFLEQWSQH